MRRESVATLRVRHLDGQWGLRGVPVKGGKIRDIPLPAAVMQFLGVYVEGMLTKQIEQSGRKRRCSGRAEGRRVVGKTRAPMTGKNVWRLCKVYGRISAPRNSSHTDLRHGVAMEVLEQQQTSSRARPARPRPHRYDANLHEHQAAGAQAGDVVLRAARVKDVKRLRQCSVDFQSRLCARLRWQEARMQGMRSMFEEHFDVPRPRSKER
jgi:hypothetical protein